MGMRISTNVSSLKAQNSLSKSQLAIGKSFAQLSSGSRITKAADDAAGLSVSETMRSQIASMKQARRNANDGISLVQVAEGGLNEISNIMIRLRELAIQSSTDSISDIEREMINTEVGQLVDETERIALSTKFGNIKLLDGSSPDFDFQVGVFNDDFQDRITFSASENSATTSNLGIDGLNFSSKDGAQEALDTLDVAQKQVNGFRANLGALQNRLVSTNENLGVQIENLSDANSRVRDADVAMSTAELAKNNILFQTSVAALTQANQNPNVALRLLQ